MIPFVFHQKVIKVCGFKKLVHDPLHLLLPITALLLWDVSWVLIFVYMEQFSLAIKAICACILVIWVHSREPFPGITENKVWLMGDVNEGALVGPMQKVVSDPPLFWSGTSNFLEEGLVTFTGGFVDISQLFLQQSQFIWEQQMHCNSVYPA